MEFQFELDNTLDSTLRKFPSNELAPSFLINTYGTDYEVVLYNRGYIKNIDRKVYSRADDIDIGDHFRVTVEGIDYRILHNGVDCR